MNDTYSRKTAVYAVIWDTGRLNYFAEVVIEDAKGMDEASSGASY